MKFLGIQALKSELSCGGSLKQADLFGYWLAATLLFQLAIFPVSEQLSSWDYLYWIMSSVMAIVMLHKCYLANGGASGEKWSDKFVSIYWVVSVRGFLIVFLPLLILGSIAATLFGMASGLSDEGVTGLVEDFVLIEVLVFELWVWLRTAAHIRDIR
ncbi:MAG: hypothetical protein NTX18_08790 [Cyanobium sp. LacPavin_0818_WC50_MAG_67_9]|nr:hypothetical protein [Cyanobium sp. LacPavin_0818_WC50_MAG_67_9]